MPSEASSIGRKLGIPYYTAQSALERQVSSVDPCRKHPLDGKGYEAIRVPCFTLWERRMALRRRAD